MVCCDLQGRKGDFTNSKTLVGRCPDCDAHDACLRFFSFYFCFVLLLAFLFIFPVFLPFFSFFPFFLFSCFPFSFFLFLFFLFFCFFFFCFSGAQNLIFFGLNFVTNYLSFLSTICSARLGVKHTFEASFPFCPLVFFRPLFFLMFFYFFFFSCFLFFL